MTETEKFNKIYHRMSSKKKIGFWHHGMAEHCHEFVRDFMVVEGLAFKVRTSPTVILHVPSGRWKGYKLPYDVALEMLKAGDEHDKELLEAMFEA